MERIVIRGGRPLRGGLPVSGAKNAALPIIAASLLARGETTLRRVPQLQDVRTMCAIVAQMGMAVSWKGCDELLLTPQTHQPKDAPETLVRRMRGSVCVLGPLLAVRGRARLALPGGCVIGPRPIDLHLKGLQALGADFQVRRGSVLGRAVRLRGARVNMRGPRGSTVLGTANVMMAAALAQGRTVIEHAAREPEVQDLAHYLNACGACIQGIGSRTLTIDGVAELHGSTHELIPDRIEAGTFLVAAAITGGRVRLEGARRDHLIALAEELTGIGVKLDWQDDAVDVRVPGRLAPVRLSTESYPGFPTDMQPQMTSLLCVAPGLSRVDDRVYPERFTHLEGLKAMGARVAVRDGQIAIEGGAALHGATVTAHDLRAGAALVVAGLAAEGTTTIYGVEQIDRGYENLEAKLRGTGAEVWRESVSGAERRPA